MDNKESLKITKNYYVNSDSDEILNFAKKNGAKIIKRNNKLLDQKPLKNYYVIHLKILKKKLIL